MHGIRFYAVAAAMLLAAGCAQRHEGYTREAKAQPPSMVVTVPPPEPQVEVPGNPPGSNYVWAPGFWEWHDHWVWVSGTWVLAPRPQAVWVPGHWHRTASQGWVWIHGYWR